MGKRRTRITIETDQIMVARRVVSPVVAWCPKCETESGMVTLTQAALLCHVDRSAIQDWIHNGRLHVFESPETGLLVCITSLGRMSDRLWFQAIAHTGEQSSLAT